MVKKEKAGNPGMLLEDDPSSIVRFYFELCHLKQIYRQGWLQRGIPAERCESVAEHSYAVAMLAMFVAEERFPELDSLKVLRLALLHDFGEIDVGDLTPSDGVAKAEKSGMERKSVERVCSLSPMGDVFIELWKEYDAGETPEAKFVRQIEKLEMALQASVYEKQGFEGLEDFFESAGREIEEEKLKRMLGKVRSSKLEVRRKRKESSKTGKVRSSKVEGRRKRGESSKFETPRGSSKLEARSSKETKRKFEDGESAKLEVRSKGGESSKFQTSNGRRES